MAYFKKRIFLDYLDFQTRNERSLRAQYSQKDLSLKFDILAFPNAQFFVAAPALAKCHDTAFLLGHYDHLWSTNRLKYVLDPRYHGSFSLYVEDRIRKLQSTFFGKELDSHFEYIGYSSPHWKAFFDGYISNHLGIRNPDERQTRSGDACFRDETSIALINDDFFEYLYSNTPANPTRILRVVEDKLSNKNDLFQREAIVRDIQSTEPIDSKTEAILHHELDNSFSRANAIAVSCLRPCDVLGINGKRLAILAKHLWITPRKNLFEFVRILPHSQVVELSQQIEWRRLISLLNLEIRNKYLDAKGNLHLLNKRLITMLPSRYFGWLQEISTMIIAFFLSPLWGSGAASMYISSIFTNAPTCILRYLSSLTNPQVTLAAMDVITKLRTFPIYFAYVDDQILKAYDLYYHFDRGFVRIAEANRVREMFFSSPPQSG
jgi:hypothetical protein